MPEPTTTSNNPTNHIHLIVSGETLSKIAARHNLRIEDLLTANPVITDPGKIMAGQRLKIPVASMPAPVMPQPVNAAPAAEPSVPRGLPNTSGMSEAEKYELFAAYFARFGVKLSEMEGDRRTILGLRVTSSTKVKQGQGEYNDRIVVTWQSADGNKHTHEFTGNTEPSARYEGKKGSDANRDGKRDLGCLPDGLYFFEKSRSAKFGNVLRPVKDIFVVRDVDHDGDFDAKDKAASVEALLSSGRSILFHAGGREITGSAGCQTMHPDVFKSFWNALGNQTRFQYVMATVQ